MVYQCYFSLLFSHTVATEDQKQVDNCHFDIDCGGRRCMLFDIYDTSNWFVFFR